MEVEICFILISIFFVNCFAVFGATQLDEPFLLPFGPLHNDRFVDKRIDQCSIGYEVTDQNRFMFGRTEVHTLYTCNNAYICINKEYQVSRDDEGN